MTSERRPVEIVDGVPGRGRMRVDEGTARAIWGEEVALALDQLTLADVHDDPSLRSVVRVRPPVGWGPDALKRRGLAARLEADAEHAQQLKYGEDEGALDPCAWCQRELCMPPLCPADPVAAGPFFASCRAPAGVAAPAARPAGYPAYDVRWARARLFGGPLGPWESNRVPWSGRLPLSWF